MASQNDGNNVFQLHAQGPGKPDEPTRRKLNDDGTADSQSATGSSTGPSGSQNTSQSDVDSLLNDIGALKPTPVGTTGGASAGTPSTDAEPTVRGKGGDKNTARVRQIGPRPNRNAIDNEYFYILTIGRQGSGKSTFQSHLLRYLKTGGDHHVELDVDHARDNDEFIERSLEWEQNWRQGKFPDATDKGSSAEFLYQVTPSRRGFPGVKFGFIEISGEDFAKLSRPDFHRTEILPSIDDFLNNPRVHLAFVFVCQGGRIGDDDILFGNFLNYLKLRTDRAFSEQSCALLVLADPQACQRALADRMQQPKLRNKPLDIPAFIEEFTPVSAAALAGWKNRATIATFSVGQLDPSGQRIVKPDFEDAQAVYDWLYEQYTGKKIGDGFFAKTMTWLRQLGGG